MTTMSNSRAQRKSLANEIDRLDDILDGLDAALAGSVETAVRDVVGQVVRETVEATVREVLSSPELIRAAVAHHTPTAPVPTQAQAPRRTIKDLLKEKLAWLYQQAMEIASQAKRNIASAWLWSLDNVRKGCAWMWGRSKDVIQLTSSALRCAWKFRTTTALALGIGTTVGVGAYFAGPIIAGVLCGLGGAAMTAAGMVLWPLWRLMAGILNNC